LSGDVGVKAVSGPEVESALRAVDPEVFMFYMMIVIFFDEKTSSATLIENQWWETG
jgi:hypothetical protein